MTDRQEGPGRDGNPRPAIVYLIGYPGAGKLTVAKAMADVGGQARRWMVIDSHYINNVIFKLIEPDGITILSDAVWERVEEVREPIFRTIEALSPPALSFIFTNVLISNSPADTQLFRRVAKIAAKRQSRFLPIRLTCDTDELERRIISLDRHRAMKWIDGAGIRDYVASTELLDVRPYGGLDLDITALTPQQAAVAILTALKAPAPQMGGPV